LRKYKLEALNDQNSSARPSSRDFGKYHDEARQHPITLTKHGRPSVVVISAELYDHMTSSGDQRRSHRADRMPLGLADTVLAAIYEQLAEVTKGDGHDEPVR
jgi:prevent-host-death family protein